MQGVLVLDDQGGEGYKLSYCVDISFQSQFDLVNFGNHFFEVAQVISGYLKIVGMLILL